MLKHHASPHTDNTGVLSYTNWAVWAEGCAFSRYTIVGRWLCRQSFWLYTESETDLDLESRWLWLALISEVNAEFTVALTNRGWDCNKPVWAWKWLLDAVQADTKHCMPRCSLYRPAPSCVFLTRRTPDKALSMGSASDSSGCFVLLDACREKLCGLLKPVIQTKLNAATLWDLNNSF